jgi:L-aminopeptidase/D-esterase-like protein
MRWRSHKHAEVLTRSTATEGTTLNRREFASLLMSGAAGAGIVTTGIVSKKAVAAQAGAESPAGRGAGSITDVPGIRVGHFTDKRRFTGCTVLILDPDSVAGVDVRGGAAATSGTESLALIHPTAETQALFLSGGSGFGLDVGTGVSRYLEAQGRGVHLQGAVVPQVAGAIIFDLEIGDNKIRPDAEAGYQAAISATALPVAEGNVGAGAGATVGKLFGNQAAMKTGLGTASLRVGNTDIYVGAIVAVNAVGDVYDPVTAKIVAGARDVKNGGFLNTIEKIKQGYGLELPAESHTNTTIGIIATNAKLDRVQVTKVAQMAHDGMARSINPVHTLWDGDTLFAAATGKSTTHVNHSALGAIAAEVLSIAIVRAATQATGIPGFPSYRDLHPKAG